MSPRPRGPAATPRSATPKPRGKKRATLARNRPESGAPLPVLRRRILLGIWLAAGIGLLVRAADVQVVQGAHWSEQAERQHQLHEELAASRGSILDRNGTPLAVSTETFRVGVAPHELTDRTAAARILAEALDMPLSEARAVTRSSKRWVQIPGRFPPRVREALAPVRGVHIERELERFYPQGSLAEGLLGRLVDHAGAGGIEAAFEEHLRGATGSEIIGRDSNGRPIPGQTWMVEAPEAGGSVVLTLDAGLQEIAHEALREAIAEHGAHGGDLLLTDPNTGEILAAVSIVEGGAGGLGMIGTPSEPGSTIKPFTVATLLREGRASLADSVDTGNGQITIAGRPLADVTPLGGMATIERALQASSNVGIALAASALSEDEQYEGLRDFGFGAPTGVSLPGESGGRLRRPNEWSGKSPSSLAIGYEVNVTPLQLVMAYGALANGGVLMEPQIVKELRDERGRVVREIEPRAVRRVVSQAIAAELTRALVGAVETGTGSQARLATFAVAGKSGTARAYGENGYDTGEYLTSFVGFFPAESPQLVVYVKLDRPSGAAYGGTTAAPVTRSTLEAILAARNPPLDRGALANLVRAPAGSDGGGGSGAANSLFVHPIATGEASAEPPPTASSAPVRIPDIRGLSPRAAARRLHFLGLHVVLESAGPVLRTVPAAGALVRPGTDVRLLAVPGEEDDG